MGTYFAKNMIFLKKRDDLSMIDLAEIVGRNSNTVYNYINKKSEPDITTLKKICNHFNLSYVEILDIDLSLHANENNQNEDLKTVDALRKELSAQKTAMKNKLKDFIKSL